ncbi:MAG: hypothetical protein GX827_02120 [Clostridiales bacterium]|jgi:hypothetical protein|nr:hypothetical protein [Clostridiales bacterium]
MTNTVILVAAILFIFTAAAAVIVYYMKKSGVISPAVDPSAENRLNPDGTIPDGITPEDENAEGGEYEDKSSEKEGK